MATHFSINRALRITKVTNLLRAAGVPGLDGARLSFAVERVVEWCTGGTLGSSRTIGHGRSGVVSGFSGHAHGRSIVAKVLRADEQVMSLVKNVGGTPKGFIVELIAQALAARAGVAPMPLCAARHLVGPQQCLIMMDRLPLTSMRLGDVLQQLERSSEPHPRSSLPTLARAVASTLVTLNDACIFHNDLHVGNIRVAQTRANAPSALVIDFGQSALVHGDEPRRLALAVDAIGLVLSIQRTESGNRTAAAFCQHLLRSLVQQRAAIGPVLAGLLRRDAYWLDQAHTVVWRQVVACHQLMRRLPLGTHPVTQTRIGDCSVMAIAMRPRHK